MEFTTRGKWLLALGLFGPFLVGLFISILNLCPTECPAGGVVSSLLSESPFHVRLSLNRAPWFLLLTLPMTLFLIWLTPLKKHRGDAFAVALVGVEILLVVIVLGENLFSKLAQ